MSKRSGLRVFAPATVANVAVGYDILGFPINGIGDELVVREGTKKGLIIKSIHGNKELSKDITKNTAGYSAFKLLQSLDLEDKPIELSLYKKMSIGTGLGSSAASAVAGVFAVNEFLGRPYSRAELLRFATEGEQVADGSFHADNVAPCLLGSFILIRDNESLDFVKLPVPLGLKVVVIHPKIKLLTQDSRAILKKEISLDLHIRQSGNLGAFVASLYKTDFDLMRRSLIDHIIEPQRARLMPHLMPLKKISEQCGALGCSISGAGPSVFSLCNNSLIAENIRDGWQELFMNQKIAYDCYISEINTEGAKVF